MQVIFMHEVSKVAHKGEVRNVKTGYFRNFLLPKKLAVMASPAKLRETEKIRKEETVKRDKMKEVAKEVAKKLEGLHIVLMKKATKQSKLYAAISEKDVVAAVKKEAKIDLDKHSVRFSKQIKELGNFGVMIHVDEGAEAKITVEVKAAT